MDAIAVAIISLLFISLSSIGTRAETQLPHRIPLGSWLHPNTLWPSPSGLFAFGFYEQGGDFAIGIWLVGAKNKTVVWTANRDDPLVTSNAMLQLTAEGVKLVVQGQEKLLIISANATASSASMLNSGNFVLYNANFSIIWQSFDYPTDTVLGGQSLPSGGQLLSSSSKFNHSTGRFCLKMQVDGKLVMYPLNTADSEWDAYWDSNAEHESNSKNHLYLNVTGFLVIRNVSNLNVITLYDADNNNNNNNEKQTIYRATLDFDGVFRLYAHLGRGNGNKVANWPREDNGCAAYGFCGFNSYCTLDDNQPYCNCLEGFDFTDPNQKTIGCKRSFSKAECKSKKDSAAFYSMVIMNDIEWYDHPYFDAQMSQEECSSSCLADCNCWATLYRYNYDANEYGDCQKQGSPLRYARRKTMFNYPTIAFLKVGKNSLKSKNSNGNRTAPEQQPPIKNASNKAIVQIVLITLCFTLFLCLTIALSSHFIYKTRVLKYKRLLDIGDFGLNEEVALRRFAYSELKRATNGFKQELGKGSFGAVYKGALYKGRRLIVVKRLEKLVEEGEREFQAEMRAIGKTHHKNLVRLLGFCAEGSKRLLVYEYMSNGSLAKLLFGAERRLEWDEKVKIALDIARGILYLHEECDAPTIHCDIKPQNILMDEFWTAKISDFGLAKLLMPDQTRTFTRVRGTRGYVAPEWHKNTPISVKADVYSYGIVLLEIVCCKRNIEVNVSQPEEVVLSNWAYKCFVARDLNKLVFREAEDIIVLENMVKVALWCVQEEPALRPTMKSVVLMLEGITNIAIPPCPTSNSM